MQKQFHVFLTNTWYTCGFLSNRCAPIDFHLDSYFVKDEIRWILKTRKTETNHFIQETPQRVINKLNWSVTAVIWEGTRYLDQQRRVRFMVELWSYLRWNYEYHTPNRITEVYGNRWRTQTKLYLSRSEFTETNLVLYLRNIAFFPRLYLLRNKVG